MHAVGASYVADGSKYFVSCGLNARGEFSSAEVLVIPQASSWRATGVVGRAQPHERDIKTQPVSARTLYSGNILSKSAQVGCFQVRHGKRGAPGFAEIRGTRVGHKPDTRVYEGCTSVGHALELRLHCLTNLRLVVDRNERGAEVIVAIGVVVHTHGVAWNATNRDERRRGRFGFVRDRSGRDRDVHV